MKKLVLVSLAILVSIKIIMLLGFTESELVIAGIIFAFYLLVERIEELQQRIKTLEYKKDNAASLEALREKASEAKGKADK